MALDIWVFTTIGNLTLSLCQAVNFEFARLAHLVVLIGFFGDHHISEEIHNFYRGDATNTGTQGDQLANAQPTSLIHFLMARDIFGTCACGVQYLFLKALKWTSRLSFSFPRALLNRVALFNRYRSMYFIGALHCSHRRILIHRDSSICELLQTIVITCYIFIPPGPLGTIATSVLASSR